MFLFAHVLVLVLVLLLLLSLFRASLLQVEGVIYDIANLPFRDLPPKFQLENMLASDNACCFVLMSTWEHRTWTREQLEEGGMCVPVHLLVSTFVRWCLVVSERMHAALLRVHVYGAHTTLYIHTYIHKSIVVGGETTTGRYLFTRVCMCARASVWSPQSKLAMLVCGRYQHDAWMQRNGSWAPPEQMLP